MFLTIDGQKVAFTVDDQSIISVADRAKVGIPAPCYRATQDVE